MAQTVVGLDIGATSIKMMRLEASIFRFEFVDFAEHPLPLNVDLPWEQLVTNVLQVLFSDRGMKADRVVVSLPGRSVSAHILTLPFSDRKKIEQTLPFEIEGMIPLPLGNILLADEVIEKGPDGTKILVLFTEKEILKSHLELLKQAGIDPARRGKATFPNTKTVVAVRAAPVLNDAVMEDALHVGLDEVADLTDTGSDLPGVWLPDSSPAFERLFREADVVISKGQGNYEGLSDTPFRGYFLFRVKCEPVAENAGFPIGTSLLLPARSG